MLKRPHYIVLGLVGLLTLLVLNLPQRTANQFKVYIGSLFLPLFGMAKLSQQVAGHAGETVVPKSELLRQVEDLTRTNQVLQIQGVKAQDLLEENTRLRQMLGFQRQSLWKLKAARVILHDPANWWQGVTIDVGSRDGVRNDMVVLTPTGALLGRISVASLASSRVALIGSAQCRVSAVIENTREMGVITGGAGPLDETIAALGYLSKSSSLKPGQIVKTSGIGGVFPGGILIGQVAEESRLTDLGLDAEAKVKLAASLRSTEEVWVIMP